MLFLLVLAIVVFGALVIELEYVLRRVDAIQSSGIIRNNTGKDDFRFFSIMVKPAIIVVI